MDCGVSRPIFRREDATLRSVIIFVIFGVTREFARACAVAREWPCPWEAAMRSAAL